MTMYRIRNSARVNAQIGPSTTCRTRSRRVGADDLVRHACDERAEAHESEPDDHPLERGTVRANRRDLAGGMPFAYDDDLVARASVADRRSRRFWTPPLAGGKSGVRSRSASTNALHHSSNFKDSRQLSPPWPGVRGVLVEHASTTWGFEESASARGAGAEGVNEEVAQALADHVSMVTRNARFAALLQRPAGEARRHRAAEAYASRREFLSSPDTAARDELY